MLYNKTWDRPVKTPEQLMALPNIVKWLEQQPSYSGYFYGNGASCLLAKYFKAYGYSDVRVSTSVVYLEGEYYGAAIEIPTKVDYVLLMSRSIFGWRTFKGALKRARYLLAQEERAHAL